MWCAHSTVAEKFKAVFIADKTHNLIVRLRHNVIRAGLRRINLAYSRIALKDVAQKLGKTRSLPPVDQILAVFQCATRGKSRMRLEAICTLRVFFCRSPGKVKDQQTLHCLLVYEPFAAEKSC